MLKGGGGGGGDTSFKRGTCNLLPCLDGEGGHKQFQSHNSLGLLPPLHILIVCFTSYFLFCIAVLAHSPGVV